jgi:hypothetical protein
VPGPLLRVSAMNAQYPRPRSELPEERSLRVLSAIQSAAAVLAIVFYILCLITIYAP